MDSDESSSVPVRDADSPTQHPGGASSGANTVSCAGDKAGSFAPVQPTGVNAVSVAGNKAASSLSGTVIDFPTIPPGFDDSGQLNARLVSWVTTLIFYTNMPNSVQTVTQVTCRTWRPD